MSTTQHVPNNLRLYRKEAGLSQLDVSRLLGLISTARLSRWEKGSATPNLINIFKLSAIYKVPPQQLYSGLYKVIQDGLSQGRSIEPENATQHRDANRVSILSV